LGYVREASRDRAETAFRLVGTPAHNRTARAAGRIGVPPPPTVLLLAAALLTPPPTVANVLSPRLPHGRVFSPVVGSRQPLPAPPPPATVCPPANANTL